MTLKEIIREKNKRIQSIPDKLLSSVDKYQKKLFAEILSLVDSLERTGGFIEKTPENLSRVIQIVDDLKLSMKDSDYSEAVKSFADEFLKQKTLNDLYFENFPDFVKVSLADDLVRKAAEDSVTELLRSPLETNFLKPIEDILVDSVATGASWKDTLDSIQQFALGSDGDGKLLQYSKQIAHDNFAFADRNYTNAISDELEIEWYFYSGAEIPTSRCFCKERHEQYFHYKEIEAWGRGENLGQCKSGELWAGAVQGTNEKTIFIYAGGHNCSHSIQPVSVFSVPKDVIERNLANGNYAPSEAELSLID